MAQNGKNAAYIKNSLKWEKRGLLVNMTCNNSSKWQNLPYSSKWQKRGFLVKVAQNGKNAAYSS